MALGATVEIKTTEIRAGGARKRLCKFCSLTKKLDTKQADIVTGKVISAMGRAFNELQCAVKV